MTDLTRILLAMNRGIILSFDPNDDPPWALVEGPRLIYVSTRTCEVLLSEGLIQRRNHRYRLTKRGKKAVRKFRERVEGVIGGAQLLEHNGGPIQDPRRRRME